jgi:hypothetical protein
VGPPSDAYTIKFALPAGTTTIAISASSISLPPLAAGGSITVVGPAGGTRLKITMSGPSPLPPLFALDSSSAPAPSTLVEFQNLALAGESIADTRIGGLAFTDCDLTGSAPMIGTSAINAYQPSPGPPAPDRTQLAVTLTRTTFQGFKSADAATSYPPNPYVDGGAVVFARAATVVATGAGPRRRLAATRPARGRGTTGAAAPPACGHCQSGARPGQRCSYLGAAARTPRPSPRASTAPS